MEQYTVTGMSCAACSARVEKAVKAVPGVTSCSVSLLTNSMGVEGTASASAIVKAVQEAGYGASPQAAAAETPSAELNALADHETPRLKKRLIASLVFLAVLMYFQEKQKEDSCIKEKRKQIEFDLPRFVYAISQEIQMSHDVISILERHKDNFSPYLNEEIEITIADMRTGNYEAAITRFEGRIGSTNLSEVCRGFIQMIRGDDTSVYWETLAIRFSELQKQYLRNIALKIPPKVHRLSFFLMMSMMLLYVVVLGWELLSNMGVLFG